MARPLSRFAGNQDGGIATAFAIGLPAVALIAAGALDLMSVRATRSAMQDAADAAALNAAMQLGVIDDSGLQPRAQEFVASNLAGRDHGLTYAVSAAPLEDEPTVTVTIDGHRDSFFVNLFPPGGWKLKVTATATQAGRTPLCVLNTGTHNSFKLQLGGNAKLTASDCLVHSNSDIEVSNSGWLQAHTVQASSTAQGRITPEPQTGAPEIDDPFASMAVSVVGKCTLGGGIGDLVAGASQLAPGLNKLSAGVHCGDIEVLQGMTLELQPGEHYFKTGKLKLNKGSVLKGDDVVLIFDKDADFAFKETSQIELRGRRQGKYAGFVVATTVGNHRTFEISTSSAREMLGTLYIPDAELKVMGANTTVNDQADWTVIVARSIKMVDSPNLVINSDYAGSSVPVPKGVGPSGGARLER